MKENFQQETFKKTLTALLMDREVSQKHKTLTPWLYMCTHDAHQWTDQAAHLHALTHACTSTPTTTPTPARTHHLRRITSKTQESSPLNNSLKTEHRKSILMMKTQSHSDILAWTWTRFRTKTILFLVNSNQMDLQFFQLFGTATPRTIIRYVATVSLFVSAGCAAHLIAPTTHWTESTWYCIRSGLSFHSLKTMSTPHMINRRVARCCGSLIVGRRPERQRCKCKRTLWSSAAFRRRCPTRTTQVCTLWIHSSSEMASAAPSKIRGIWHKSTKAVIELFACDQPKQTKIRFQ